MSKLLTEVDAALAKNQSICVRLFAILPETEKVLEYIVRNILEKFHRADLLSTVYTSVKELAVNGTKANFKRILFDEQGIDWESDESYDQGMAIFRTKLNEHFIIDYAKKGKAMGLLVEVLFDYGPEVMFVRVINNVPISRREDERIRKKFQKSMSYDDIAQFYMEAGDSTEGAGMGITLVTMLMKSSELDPHGFTIRSDHEKKTIAKLEIPLNDGYTTSRIRYTSE